MAICFDLDGVYGMEDSGQAEEVVGKRLDKVKAVLDCISSPVLACIARSQRPRTYVPPGLVDSLQKIVLHEYLLSTRIQKHQSVYCAYQGFY